MGSHSRIPAKGKASLRAAVRLPKRKEIEQIEARKTWHDTCAQHGALSTSLQLAVSIPVSVWVDGEDPGQAVAGQVCLVTENFIRVRGPCAFDTGVGVRIKTPLRTRSLVGRFGGGTDGAGGKEFTIWAEGIGAYFGIVFPKAGARKRRRRKPRRNPRRSRRAPLPRQLQRLRLPSNRWQKFCRHRNRLR